MAGDCLHNYVILITSTIDMNGHKTPQKKKKSFCLTGDFPKFDAIIVSVNFFVTEYRENRRS